MLDEYVSDKHRTESTTRRLYNYKVKILLRSEKGNNLLLDHSVFQFNLSFFT